ncbi:MAG: cytochrome P450 [Halalkalicoccus sp.]
MSGDEREGEAFFLDDPEKLDDPFSDLAYFREHRPVFYYEPLDQWFVFGYDDVAALFADERLSADRMKGFVDAAPEAMQAEVGALAPFFETWVLMKDGADHARLRKFLLRGFNAASTRELRGRIEEIAEGLLDDAERRGRIDAASDYGFLLPAYVLSAFMGVHEEDRDRIVQWSVDFVDFFNEIPITEETSERMVKSASEMREYTLSLLEERRSDPRDDFLGTLVAAEGEDDGPTEDEIVGNAMLLLLAGHVAVRNLIGNVVYLLLTHPEQRAALRSDPTLLHNAIEETLRYEPPVSLIPRVALSDVEFGGHAIGEGQIVQLSIASANRDATHFPDPDRFDISRPPGGALSFGHGPHTCLGVHLAKEQTRIAVEALFRRFPDLELDGEREIEWYRNAGNRGPESLPLVF